MSLRKWLSFRVERKGKFYEKESKECLLQRNVKYYYVYRAKLKKELGWKTPLCNGSLITGIHFHQLE